MAMKKKGAAKSGVRKMKAGSVVSKKERERTQQEALRAKARNASNKARGDFNSPTSAKKRAAEAKAFAAERKRLANKRKNKLMSKGVGSGDDRYTQAVEVYDNTGIRDHYEQPSHLGGRRRKITDPNTMPNGMPKINPGRRYDLGDVIRGFNAGGKVAKKKAGGAVTKKKAGGAVTKKKAGGAVTKKMGGGTMKKKGMAKGGKLAKMNPGGKLNMVKNKAGKMVPDFAADGVGKSAAGGRVAKKMVGGAMKKKGMAKGGAVTKKKAGGAVTKKMGGGKMMKKGYAKGGAVTKNEDGWLKAALSWRQKAPLKAVRLRVVAVQHVLNVFVRTANALSAKQYTTL